MKNIFKKIHIQPLYIFFVILVIFTANFKAFITFSILLIIHELGHIITALIFKWDIDKIVVLPYGMITIFKNSLSKPIYQEFLILIMGPIFQIVFNLYFKCEYSNFLLFLNLLPIYPLDGSKFVFLFFNKIFSYYFSYILIYVVSFITIIMLLFKNNNLLITLTLITLIYQLIKHIYNLSYLIINFCFERFKSHFYTSHSLKVSNNINKMHRDKYHYFNKNGKYVEESVILREMFDKL